MGKLNNVNLSEVDTYKELFDIQEKNHKDMENATYSLLDSIPKDVTSIADIGAGPGIVNRYIPSNIHVIAIDLDEEILKHNNCETHLGDILDIPLKDDSVDMSIACDVLEHIEPDKLNRAVAEMKRVAKKYVYFQTPNEEILRYSIAYCSDCGNKWHVNFHKGTFNEKRFFEFEDDKWEIIRINYTGDVENQKDNPQIYRRIEEENLDIYRVEGFRCPKCGGMSCLRNYEELARMELEDCPTWRAGNISPKYFEIGILYAKRDMPRQEMIIENGGISKEIRKDNYMDLTKRQRCSMIFSGKEQIPFVIGDEKILNFDSKGLHLKGKDYVGFMFPRLNSSSKAGFLCIPDDMANVLVTRSSSNEQKPIISKRIKGKKKLKFSCKDSDLPLFWVYTDRDIVIQNVYIKTKDHRNRKYSYYMSTDKNRDLFKVIKNGVIYSYLITKGGVGFGEGGDNNI